MYIYTFFFLSCADGFPSYFSRAVSLDTNKLSSRLIFRSIIKLHSQL